MKIELTEAEKGFLILYLETQLEVLKKETMFDDKIKSILAKLKSQNNKR